MEYCVCFMKSRTISIFLSVQQFDELSFSAISADEDCRLYSAINSPKYKFISTNPEVAYDQIQWLTLKKTIVNYGPKGSIFFSYSKHKTASQQ